MFFPVNTKIIAFPLLTKIGILSLLWGWSVFLLSFPGCGPSGTTPQLWSPWAPLNFPAAPHLSFGYKAFPTQFSEKFLVSFFY